VCVSQCVILVVKLFTQLVQRLHNNLQSGSFSLSLKGGSEHVLHRAYIYKVYHTHMYKYSRGVASPSFRATRCVWFRGENAICMYAIFGDGARGRKLFDDHYRGVRARQRPQTAGKERKGSLTQPAHTRISAFYTFTSIIKTLTFVKISGAPR
jgi:hypothetical protein